MHTPRTADSAGFSLVELIVSVAIVGILGSMVIPSYKILSRKAKSSQAVSNLSTIYGLEKIFQAEYGAYTTRLDSLGFQPRGTLYFNVGFTIDYPPPAAAPQGSANCNQACPNPYDVADCANATWSCAPSAGNSLDATILGTATSTTFVANAHAHWENVNNGETYYINEKKEFHHIPDGAAN